MKPTVIGILTFRRSHKFHEPTFLRDLVREGQRLGHTVYLFSEHDLLESRRQIRGFVPSASGSWTSSRYPWPEVVIDRRRSSWTPAFRAMRRRPLFPYANSKFTLKWVATRLFARTKETKRWIPKTVLYTPERLRRMLQEFPIVYVKPGNGTGGSSVVKIERRDGGGYAIQGRQRGGALSVTRLGGVRETERWIGRWLRTQQIRAGRFMIQQGLDLRLVPDRVVDCRLLIQKNGEGKWGVTGIAARLGGRNSPTTNLLYGDGKAYPFDAFMAQRFGKQRAAEIRAECEEMAQRIVETIERRYGSMMEFGLDVGVDVDGRVWLIEANPKPTRDVFLKTGERSVYRTAVRRPLEYAAYVARKSGRPGVSSADGDADSSDDNSTEVFPDSGG